MSKPQSSFIKYANNYLKTNKEKMIYQYFHLQQEAEEKYGTNTVVLIQVGDFYEIYQYDKYGKTGEISKALNFQKTKKSKRVEEVSIDNPLMSGFPKYALEKHLNTMIGLNKWTIVVVEQVKYLDEKNKEKVYRKVQNVISKGVNVEFNENDNYNFISSIYIDKLKDIYYCGLSMVDVSVGKVLVYEGYGDMEDTNLILDEINNFINIYSSSEIIISHSKDIKQMDIDFIKKELNLNNMNYIINDNQKEEFPISYQNEIYKEIYNIESVLSPIEELNLERLPLASNSLISLFNFVIEHNPEIIYELDRPIVLEQQNKLYCGNNAIKQLNIIDDNLSIEKIINTSKTAFGKRYIKELLLNPIKDSETINKRLDLSGRFLKLEKETVSEIKSQLYNVYDIERYERLINLKDIQTKFFYNFHYSIKEIEKVMGTLIKSNFYINDLEADRRTLIDTTSILSDIEKHFDIDKLLAFNPLKKDQITFIKEGISPELDDLIKKKEKTLLKLENTKNFLLNLNQDLNPKLKTTDIEGHYLEITKSKYELIKGFFVKDTTKYDSLSETNKEKVKEYKFRTFSNSIKITSEEMKSLSNEFFVIENRIAKLSIDIFKTYIHKFNHKEELNKIIYYIKKVDFCIVNYNLHNLRDCVKPEIIKTKNQKKFLEIQSLRHLIVENDERNGIYIPNDFFLGDSEYIDKKELKEEYQIKEKLNGIMLHGLNASGKSTLIKSIGVALIMAQSGFYVPAKKMRFSIFDSIFTRISGSDNIHKGLSTFTIEMLEMKNIFNRSKGNTLVLGDELSHGTETQSAISIVASGFLTLVEQDSLFIFATHLHQLNELKEITNNENLIPLHLHVKHDKVNDKFIFDRKLKYGQGLSTYGLEYAKYLNLNNNFIKRAYSIRKNITTEKTNLELLLDKKESVYNKDIYMKQCALCSKRAIETHHIQEQREANDFNMINSIHKNHKYNLIPLCEEHHKKVHNGNITINGFIMTSNGLELTFRENE